MLKTSVCFGFNLSSRFRFCLVAEVGRYRRHLQHIRIVHFSPLVSGFTGYKKEFVIYM